MTDLIGKTLRCLEEQLPGDPYYRCNAFLTEGALFRAAAADPVVHRPVMEVGQLLQPQSRLQEPDITQQIETPSIRAAA